MYKKLVTILPILLFSCLFFAQESETPSNTIEGQFVKVIDKSNNYQQYKVIEKYKLAALRKNILDSIAKLETEIGTLNGEIGTQKTEIVSLTANLGKTNEDLSISMEKENGIQLLGMLMQKSTYNSIMWSIIGLLMAGLVFFVYKFKNSNSVTREAKNRLDETETEFEEHRQKKLEEVQQIRRKLQDEINKNKKV